MANQEQLAILKQGVEVWNNWRSQNPNVEIMFDRIDLSGANLTQADLSRVYIADSNLSGANFSKANLGGANLGSTKLSGADLSGANLTVAYLAATDLNAASLSGASLYGANLRGAKLANAHLIRSNLFEANLTLADFLGADLNGADLRNVNLTETNLRNASFKNVVIGGTILADIDLSITVGLESVIHDSASTLGTNTLMRSMGNIPEVFLRGCGLSDWEIEQAKMYNPRLRNHEFIDIQNRIFDLRHLQAIQISPLFISYSHSDGAFVDRLEKQLIAKGVRFWRDIHDLKAGRIEKQIDRAISQNRTVLLVLSENSLNSDWVEHEVRTARGKEKDTESDVLCPVALDGSWKDNRWPKRVMEQIMEYNILDFSEWKDDSKFHDMFRKLIDGLELFYKG